MTSKRKVAVILTDAAGVPDDDPHFFGLNKRSRASVEYLVSVELRALGYETLTVPFDTDIEYLSARLRELAPKIIFNLTEEAFGIRSLDASIAGLLELLRYDYTGAGVRGLMLGRDKAVSKNLLRAAGIRVPDFCVIGPGRRVTGELPPFPAVVKPIFGDGSDGMTMSSLVRNEKQMHARAAILYKRFNQPSICEQYIVGREFLSFIVGNHRQRLLPIVEITWEPKRHNRPRIASYRAKHDLTFRKRVGMGYRTAPLTRDEEQRIARITRDAFAVLEMRDYGKVDMMMDAAGELYVIEGNPNPCLESKARSLKRWGSPYTFHHLIRDVVNGALARGKKK